MKIRRATIHDAKGIAKVQVDSWKTTYRGIVPDAYLENMTYESRENQWKLIFEKKGIAFVAENEDGQIIGFSSCGKERSGEYPSYSGEIYAIYILQEYQRRGVGRKLVEPVVDYLTGEGLTSMIVIVLAENSSRHFYESLGAKKLDELETVIGGKLLVEDVYGWENLFF